MKNQAILHEITAPLLYWYQGAARDLPWRRSPTPYHVWISEIMLQQTRVEAVKGYYARFLDAFPKIVFPLTVVRVNDTPSSNVIGIAEK